MTPSALTVAGFDPSGGAGLQADLRAFAALGVAGFSVASALTVQDSRGVRSVHPVAPGIMRDQLEAVFSDAPVGAVKVGMLAGAAQARALARALRRFTPPNVVLDPVLASTAGFPLLDAEGRKALLAELVPLCDLLTPNLAEASALAGLKVVDEEGMARAGAALLRLGARAVLVKGGHLAGRPTDILLRPGTSPLAFVGRRAAAAHSHGTGCLLSSAIAAHLALGRGIEESIRLAKDLLGRALESPVAAGGGRGYPEVGGLHERRLARLKGLYVLTDSALRPDRSPEEIVRAAVAGGAVAVQLREKRLGKPALLRLAKRLCALAREEGTLFIVNDSVEVALASDADGVHLGPDDMLPEEARRLLGPDRLVGVSVGTLYEARLAAPRASYLGVGAVFGSSTKADAGPPVGLGLLREIAAACPGRPLAAIGGINEDNIAEIARAGAAAAAVVSAVVCAPDMREAAARLATAFARGRRPALEAAAPSGGAPEAGSLWRDRPNSRL